MKIFAGWRESVQCSCLILVLGVVCGICVPVVQAQAQPEGAFLSRFDLGSPLPEGWRISHFAVRSSHNRAAWNRQSVTGAGTEGQPLELRLHPAPPEARKDFFGGELQRVRRTHYGHYEVVMTAAASDGVISSFFTYTGPYFGDPQDEIDFEFLGRDTTKVWINRFAKGEKLPGEWLDLGFDAAAEPHLYAFDWLPDRLVWYVDGQELYRIEAPDRVIPDIPGRIYINIWAGSSALAGWSGNAASDTETVAAYHCISYRPPTVAAPMCSDGTENERNADD